MYYTVLTVLIWLLVGTPPIEPTFNPITVAFAIAILADLATYEPWKRKELLWTFFKRSAKS